MIELYDHEIAAVIDLAEKLRSRYEQGSCNYEALEREIKGRYAELGFRVNVNWYGYAIGGVRQEGAMPEVSIEERIDKGFVFDPDRQVHEVTNNLLDIPGEEGVIKTDDGGAFKKFREEQGHGHSPAHGHSHPHPH